ncbi:TPA: hypothetical protein DDZ86_02645 [Candidatus Dependentiae bacterium]|nr:MAG: MurG: undecaprenyldiphospho-muramoylpentapeptide beta-N-acetylglucosaminyltransferase [candidate division TM6 bacterium GW2011_GWF2_43_87]HBL98517.1 hypothetical protein [Candidatus Dependentiae bacterium]
MFSFKKLLKNFFIIVLCSILGLVLIGGATLALIMLTTPKAPRPDNASCICYVTGKSGGHLFPALTLAKEYANKSPNGSTILFFSTDTPLDKLIIKKAPQVNVYEPLSLRNVPRNTIIAWPGYCLDLLRISIKITRTFARYRPEAVVSMGGYISVPVGLIAWLLRIPVYVYELNVVPGSAVQFLSRFATTTFTCFNETAHLLPPKAHVERAAYPIRFAADDKLSKTAAREHLKITGFDKVLLVVGGSQGSRFINDLVPEGLASIKAQKSVFVIHQTGEGEVKRVQELYEKKGLHALVFAFRDDMNVLYSAANLVVARAGAGSLFESVFFATPSLIIPLETEVTDHQLDNALAMEKEHPLLFSVLRQGAVEKKPNLFTQKLSELLQ